MINFKKYTFLIIAFLALGFTACKDKAGVSTAGTGTATSGIVVYLNIDTLLEKYDLYQESKTLLEDESRKADQALAGKVETFQKRAADFQQRVYQTQQRAQDLAPVQLQALEQKFAAEQQKLAKEEADLTARRDNAARDLEGKLIDLQKNLKDNIDAHLEKIAAERGYDYVLIKGSGGGVLFGKKTLDITDQTIKELNEMHAAGGSKSAEIVEEVISDTTETK
ncbi:MAG: OmpH family outer membrane protein [Saprospiraceae bacterium]|nr:OmpH family outer membrane protein [Saprospiraceae bacterium]